MTKLQERWGRDRNVHNLKYLSAKHRWFALFLLCTTVVPSWWNIARRTNKICQTWTSLDQLSSLTFCLPWVHAQLWIHLEDVTKGAVIVVTFSWFPYHFLWCQFPLWLSAYSTANLSYWQSHKFFICLLVWILFPWLVLLWSFCCCLGALLLLLLSGFVSFCHLLTLQQDTLSQ